MLGLVQANEWPLASALGASLAGLVLLGVFVAWARGRPGAALDLSLFAEPSYAWVNAATLAFGAVFSMMFLGFFLFLTGPWGYSLGQAGLMVTPGPLTVIPVAVLAGRLAGRIGHRPQLVAGGLLFAVSNLWFAVRLGATPDWLGAWLPGQLMGGVAVGLVLPALSGAAVARLAPTRFGVGNAANSAIRQVGGALGAAAAVLIAGRADAGLEAFRMMYLVMAAGSVLTALLCLPVDTRPRG